MIDFYFDIFSGQFNMIWKDSPAPTIPQVEPDTGMPYGFLLLLTYPAPP